MPINRAVVDALTPPEGWRWYRRPSWDEYYNTWVEGHLTYAGQTLEAYDACVDKLVEWALANNMMVQVYNNTRVNSRDLTRTAQVWTSVTAIPVDREAHLFPVREDDMVWSGFTREMAGNNVPPCFCGGYHRAGQVICPNTNQLLSCETCLTAGNPGGVVEGGWACSNHLRRCRHAVFGNMGPDTCRNFAPARNNRRYCAEHADLTTCPGCNTEFEAGTMHNVGNSRVCHGCYHYACGGCGAVDRAARHLELPDGGWRCIPCFDVWENGRNEEYDEQVDNLGPDALLVENFPLRPSRVISIEMECVDGGDRLAQELYRAGLTPFDEVMRYHHAVGRDVFCHVERDSSLGRNGGELIFHRMRLDDAEEAEKLHEAVSIVRKLIKEGNLGMDSRCGLHMHVDAHQFGIGHVRNLVLVFNYLEDILYRAGGAKYGIGHRGYQYAAKLHKGDYKDKQTFGMQFFGQNGHAHALNVGNYWGAMRERCMCGAAMVGNHEKCTCNLGKCTFEFRVWNGSANYRKIRAYAAISQSLVAFARNMDDLDDEILQPMEYVDNSPISDENKPKIIERLTWMLSNLYFTPGEREDVLYLIENSSLNTIGAEAVADIRRVRYESPRILEEAAPVYYGARKNPQEAPNQARGFQNLFDDVQMANPFIRFEPEPMGDLDYDDDDEF